MHLGGTQVHQLRRDVGHGEGAAAYVRYTLVDRNGNTTENTVAFRANSSGASDVSVAFGDARAAYVEVLENSADYYAVMYVEGAGGDIYCGNAYFRWGSAGNSDETFSDVPSDQWYSDYVGAAVRMGLINGMGDGTYAPESNLTYAQAITLRPGSLSFTAARTRRMFLRHPRLGTAPM